MYLVFLANIGRVLSPWSNFYVSKVLEILKKPKYYGVVQSTQLSGVFGWRKQYVLGDIMTIL